MHRLRGLAASPWLHVGLTAALALVLAVLAHRLWRADLSEPLHYAGDGYQYLMYAKAIHENGWYLENGRLGAPFALLTYDFPEGGVINMAALRLLDLAIGNWLLAFNLLFLLSYPLAALATLWALRRLAIAPAVAIALSLLYALAPYHLDRNVNHYLLSFYYGLPPALSFAVTTAAGREPLPLSRRDVGARQWVRRSAAPLLAALLAGLMSIYYVAFAALMLLAGGFFGWLHSRRIGVLLSAGALTTVLVAAMLVQYAPALAYRLTEGANSDVAPRPAGYVEGAPLKPADMLLPVPGHPIRALAELRARYRNFPSHSQPGVALGTIGSLGLIVALGGFVIAAASGGRRGSLVGRLRSAGWLATTAIAIGMLGGGATFISLVFGTYLRLWDRLSIAIAFFALAGLGMLVTVMRRRVRRAWRGPLLAVAAAALLVVGTLDQAGGGFWVRPYQSLAQRWHADARFVAQAEAALPEGAMVYQLPHVAFPERTVGTFRANDHIPPYLHSSHLRWSAPRMAGREPGWQVILSAGDTTARLKLLRVLGFGGVYVNRAGYAGMGDDGPTDDQLVAELSADLGTPVATSEDGRLLLFALVPADVDDETRAAALDPIWLRWTSGFEILMQRGEHVLHEWRDEGIVELRNNRPAERSVLVSFVVEAVDGAPRSVELSWPDGTTEQLAVGDQPLAHQRRLSLPAGISFLRLAAADRSSGRPPLALIDLLVIDTDLEVLVPAGGAGAPTG